MFKPIVLKSVASGETIYQAYVFEMGDRTISTDSAIQHTPDEIGTVFKEIPVQDSKQWLTLSSQDSDCTVENPLKVGPFGHGIIYWKLTLPNSLQDGNYVIHVRITPAGGTGGVNINCDYAIPFLIQVNRAPSTGFKWAMWMTALVAVVSCVIGVLIMVLLERRKKREEKREEVQ